MSEEVDIEISKLHKALTPNEIQFCENFISGMSLKDSVEKAGYKANNAKSCARMWISLEYKNNPYYKPRMVKYINTRYEQIQAENTVTVGWWVNETQKNYHKSVDEGNTIGAIKCLDMIGKYLGVFHEKVKIEKNIEHNIYIGKGKESVEDRIKNLMEDD